MKVPPKALMQVIYKAYIMSCKNYAETVRDLYGEEEAEKDFMKCKEKGKVLLSGEVELEPASLEQVTDFIYDYFSGRNYPFKLYYIDPFKYDLDIADGIDVAVFPNMEVRRRALRNFLKMEGSLDDIKKLGKEWVVVYLYPGTDIYLPPDIPCMIVIW